jgi:hypothetical protein
MGEVVEGGQRGGEPPRAGQLAELCGKRGPVGVLELWAELRQRRGGGAGVDQMRAGARGGSTDMVMMSTGASWAICAVTTAAATSAAAELRWNASLQVRHLWGRADEERAVGWEERTPRRRNARRKSATKTAAAGEEGHIRRSQ